MGERPMTLQRQPADSVRTTLRGWLPSPAYKRLASLLDAWWCARRIGWSNYRLLRRLYPDRGVRQSELTAVTVSYLPYPFMIRPGTTDAHTFIQTFAREEYGHYLPCEPVRFIIDAGAYIGDTSVYYLKKYPDARLIAIEPDPANFAIAQRNLDPYGKRVELIHAAIWPYVAQLKINASEAAYAVSVEEKLNDTLGYMSCSGISLANVLDESSEQQIDLLKCDIEGAEQQVFAENSDVWLSRTRTIFIEIHHRAALDAVLVATRRHGFSWRAHRSVHVFHRQHA